jgi:hypothetical protein
MLNITDKASSELAKAMESPKAKGKNLILYYMGAG